MDYGLKANAKCAFGECTTTAVHIVWRLWYKLYDGRDTRCMTTDVQVAKYQKCIRK